MLFLRSMTLFVACLSGPAVEQQPLLLGMTNPDFQTKKASLASSRGTALAKVPKLLLRVGTYVQRGNCSMENNANTINFFGDHFSGGHNFYCVVTVKDRNGSYVCQQQSEDEIMHATATRYSITVRSKTAFILKNQNGFEAEYRFCHTYKER